MSDKTERKTWADYLLALAGILIPIVLVYLGHIYKDTESKQGIHEKYVELAIDILKEEPANSSNELRVWAIKVLDEYSEVPIHEEAQKHMVHKSFSQE